MMKAMQVNPFTDLARLVEEATPAECPMLCGELERLKAALWLKIATGSQRIGPSQPDSLLTAAQVADRLNVTTGFIYKNAPSYPFMIRQGRYIRFSSQGLENYLRRRQGQ
jgi:hypothetical protein